MDKPAKLYEQVKQHLRDGIAAGTWKEGDRVSSEFELMETLGASRMTVHRALREMAAEGLLLRIQGVGTFVQRPAPRSALLEIHDIAEDIAARGHAHRATVLHLEARRADAALAADFQLPPRAKLHYSEIVHFENDVAVQLEERFISASFAPDYLRQNFTQITTNRYLLGIAPPDEVEHVIHAAAPDVRTQERLLIGPQEPCLRLLRRTWIGARLVTFSILTHPGERYSLGSRYRHGRV
jgi:GntR family transcriptional regulator, histidine utilization repressor